VANHAAGALQETSVQFLAPVQLIALHAQAAIDRHAHELVGVQETQKLLDGLGKEQPALVTEAVPKRISVSGLAELLARLAEERVSLRHLRTILEAIVATGGDDRSLDALAERARQSLRRAITRSHANSQGEVAAFVLDPLIEEAVRDSVTRSSVQSALPPSLIADVQAGARAAFGKLAHPVVLTNARIRRALWKMLSPEAPGVTVLSYDELLPETPIETLGRISPAA
jgi:type III secretion protein V